MSGGAKGEYIMTGGGERRGSTPAALKGLQNRYGENNCFLNTVIQVLWQLDCFREEFAECDDHCCSQEGCVFCALKVVFVQFEFCEDAAIPPDALRVALHSLYADQDRFQLFQYDDAVECFDAVIQCLSGELSRGRVRKSKAGEMTEKISSSSLSFLSDSLVFDIFGMRVLEKSACCKCGAKSSFEFDQSVQYVPVNLLCKAMAVWNEFHSNGNLFSDDYEFWKQRYQSVAFSDMLNMINEIDERPCPEAEKTGCVHKNPIHRQLLSSPRVIAISFVWETESATQQHIHEVLNAVGAFITANSMFYETPGEQPFPLRGMICYYGKHYVTFFYSRRKALWFSFDDALITIIGKGFWDVYQKCVAGHYQPLLLLYGDCCESEESFYAQIAASSKFVFSATGTSSPTGGKGSKSKNRSSHVKRKSSESRNRTRPSGSDNMGSSRGLQDRLQCTFEDGRIVSTVYNEVVSPSVCFEKEDCMGGYPVDGAALDPCEEAAENAVCVMCRLEPLYKHSDKYCKKCFKFFNELPSSRHRGGNYGRSTSEKSLFAKSKDFLKTSSKTKETKRKLRPAPLPPTTKGILELKKPVSVPSSRQFEEIRDTHSVSSTYPRFEELLARGENVSGRCYEYTRGRPNPVTEEYGTAPASRGL
eukprot:Nk52_evm40s62 gene=Nk52_evmTU40s62